MVERERGHELQQQNPVRSFVRPLSEGEQRRLSVEPGLRPLAKTRRVSRIVARRTPAAPM
jgi:hypothetical protein